MSMIARPLLLAIALFAAAASASAQTRDEILSTPVLRANITVASDLVRIGDVIDNAGSPSTKLRFTGTAIETVEAAILARGVERNEIIKSADVTIERRPKSEVGNDVASRDRTVGMQARRQLRAGAAVKGSDLSKPDLVQRDQSVMLIYETSGLYLTIRGKALEGGTEGDVVSVLNLQSKRTVTGVVVGRGQVAVSIAPPRAAPETTSSLADPSTAPVSVANANPQAAAKTE